MMALSGLQEVHERLHLIDQEREARVVYQMKSGLSDETSSGFPVNHENAII